MPGCVHARAVPFFRHVAPRVALSSRPDRVLPRANRLTDGADYRAVVRRGARCSSPHTVAYVGPPSPAGATRFGFIVSKQVGSAVVRNAVRRRLKAICADAMPRVKPGSQIVIRALPAAAAADFSVLRAEVGRCLERRAA